MIPSTFEYHSPTSLDDALALLGEYGDGAKVLAGGHSLIPLMKLRLAAPDHLIDYQQQGKRSYYLASTLDEDAAPVLRRLSDEFELCAFGLSRVRREWEKHEAEPPHGPSGIRFVV